MVWATQVKATGTLRDSLGDEFEVTRMYPVFTARLPVVSRQCGLRTVALGRNTTRHDATAASSCCKITLHGIGFDELGLTNGVSTNMVSTNMVGCTPVALSKWLCDATTPSLSSPPLDLNPFPWTPPLPLLMHDLRCVCGVG